MLTFFAEGGWGMWPVLVFGATTIGASIRFLRSPEPAKFGFILAMSVTTLVTALLATWTNVAAVFNYLEDPARVADAEVTRVLMSGMKECTRPGTLAGLMLATACLIVAAGLAKAGRRQHAAARAA